MVKVENQIPPPSKRALKSHGDDEGRPGRLHPIGQAKQVSEQWCIRVRPDLQAMELFQVTPGALLAKKVW